MSLRMSTRGRYAVRLMTALALRHGEEPAQLKEIARAEAISEKYLGQILIPLRASGLVVSRRGARGGYALARPPLAITVKQVVEAVEGPMAVVPCEPGCGRLASCAAALVWRRLTADIDRSLSSFTLADLVQQARELAGQASDYTI